MPLGTRACGFAFAVALLLARGANVPVPNGGFENGGDSPEHWSWSLGEGGTGTSAVETRIVHGGQRSFRVTKTGVVGYTDLCGDLVPVEAGRAYEVTAWVYPLRHVRRGVYFMVNQFPAGSPEGQLPNTFGPTTEPLVAGEWQQVKVQIDVRSGNDRIRIHCIQAFSPSDLYWDDLRIDLAGAAPRPRYEPAGPEPLPDLAPAQGIVRQRPRATAKVELRGGRPRLIVDSRPVPWAFYVSPPWNYLQGAQIADFREAGVHVFLVPLILGRDVYPSRGPWLGPERYDFSEVDDLLWRVLRVDPQAYVLFYMGCDAYRSWGAENPDEVTQDREGRKAVVAMHPRRWGGEPQASERFGPSIVSLKLRRDTAAALRELVRHIEGSEPGKAVIGYHVAGYNDGQWFHWESLAEGDTHLADYSPGAVASFREWLARRYAGDVSALRQAWNQPQVTFATAVPPSGERMLADGFLLDPRTQGDIADFSRFHSEGVAETVGFLAAVLKEATPRPIVCGTYYEDITCNSNSHIALRLHLTSPGIDYLAGPAAYNIRLPGYPGAVRSVFASTLLHGKTYLTEQDWRSFKSSPDGPAENFAWGRAETAEVHNAMVRRECGMMLAFGLGTWWYDMSGGWFHDPGIMAGIAEATRAFSRELQTDRPPPADLAVFVSEDSNHWLAPMAQGFARFQGILDQVQQLNTSGVPYRLYLQSDLADPRLPEHRAYLFLNPYWLGESERQALERLKRDGKTLIFLQAPGVVNASDAAETVSALTGVRVVPAAGVVRPALEALPTDHPLVRDLDGYLGTSSWPGNSPCFAVADPQATVFARYRGTDQAAAADRDFGTWRSVFIGVPGLTDAFVHNLARNAGCWCAAEAGDAVYASDRFITLHAIFPGAKTLHLARPARVTDLTSGQVLGERAETVRITVRRGETRWFGLDEL
jgi:beta-galactosidase